MIFVMMGSFIGSIVSFLALILLAIGAPFYYEDDLTVSRVFFVTFFVTWIASTLWLFRKKRKVDYRWNSEKYLHCLRCGYDLRGNHGTKCPECGYEMTSTQQHTLSINHA